MKKSSLILICLCSQLYFVNGQNNYKQNILDLLKKYPEIKSCDNSYSFFNCKDNSCNNYKSAKLTLNSAIKDIANAQVAMNSSLTGGQTGTAMNQEDGAALQEKLSKMSDAEKQQWAMQNAGNFMNATNMRPNQDMDNTVVNDALDIVRKQQQEDMKIAAVPNNLPENFNQIDKKYKPQTDALLKTFQAASGTNYDPMWQSSYVFGETSQQDVDRFNKALAEYMKNIYPLLNAEINEKMVCVKNSNQDLVTRYKIVEEKIAATLYGDDALEAVNKNSLLQMQQTIINKVFENFEIFETMILTYANTYAALQKIAEVKGFEDK
jgi:hypothetical protein